MVRVPTFIWVLVSFGLALLILAGALWLYKESPYEVQIVPKTAKLTATHPEPLAPPQTLQPRAAEPLPAPSAAPIVAQPQPAAAEPAPAVEPIADPPTPRPRPKAKPKAKKPAKAKSSDAEQALRKTWTRGAAPKKDTDFFTDLFKRVAP